MPRDVSLSDSKCWNGKDGLTYAIIFLIPPSQMAHAPPGHHSVVGRPSSGGLCYPEYVVYRGEQVGLVLRFM